MRPHSTQTLLSLRGLQGGCQELSLSETDNLAPNISIDEGRNLKSADH